ncbi:MAG: alanine--tRNA ligase [Pyrinomonadaceae bacterium]
MNVYDNLNETQQFACRVIADHARSTAFAIADGILPGNEGRNYVLRKIMRRAIYHGREHLGYKDPFFYKVCDFVVEQMREAYPELEVQREFIGKMVRLEEERFGNTVTVGLGKLNELRLSKDVERSGELFRSLATLYDTYGTPKDLIRVFLEDKGVEFGEDEFDEKFEEAIQELQRQSGIGKTQRGEKINPIYAELFGKIGANQFHGYDRTEFEEAKIVAILDGETEIELLALGSQGSVVLDQTPFYAEAGGQVGDTGLLNGTEKKAFVTDTYAPISGLIIHKVKVRVGSLKVGDTVHALVDVQKRDATRRNHTATHLVHAALREVLGTHVKQAGSVVAPNNLRFDFTHYQPISESELTEVEDLVNRHILENHPVNTNVMAIEEAMRDGAMALFGEKYGSDVRVLSVGDGIFSKELCGGTHVRATGDIGSFKIMSDEAVASGVRRIRAITGIDAFDRFREDEKLIERSLGALKTQRDNLPNAIERLQEELKRTRKENDELKLKIATGPGGPSSKGDEAKDIGGVMVLGKIVEGLDANGTRQLSDTLLNRLKSGVVILGRSDEGKASIIVRVSNDLTERIKAGNVIKEIAPIIGGRGGGKADMAEGGGSEPEKLSEAVEAAYGVIEKMIV